MPGLRPDIDPDGLLEYSVVFTDRSLNHMSAVFGGVMRDLSEMLRQVYNASAVALVPGGGTFAMEAVARHLARGRQVMVIRNGWFSYRWSQIFDAGVQPAESMVMGARRMGEGPKAPFAPAPMSEVVAAIRSQAPQVVFAPHVETSSGMILPDDYIAELAEAVHEVGGLLVLDCIASGCVWVDMQGTGVDVLISAPQKGWSSSPSTGCVMLSDRGRDAVKAAKSDSFAMDLGRWLEIMESYEAGGHAYHATMPTDALKGFRDTMRQSEGDGFAHLARAQWDLGKRVRSSLEARNLPSVAAEGFQAPGVVVSYTDRDDLRSGAAFAAAGAQIAAGVPLMVGEGSDYKSFRIGLFGIDKLRDIDGTVSRLDAVLDRVLS